jgi:hypothetical protein
MSMEEGLTDEEARRREDDRLAHAGAFAHHLRER